MAKSAAGKQHRRSNRTAPADRPAPAPEPLISAPSARGPWGLAIGGLVVLGLLAGCEKIYNADVFWHLTAGQWMLANGQVLRQDFWSSGAPHPWVNVHWLFQVVIAAIDALAGANGLVVMKMLLLAGILAALALPLRRRAWVALAGPVLLAATLTIQVRLRARPEAFTMLLLAVTLGLVESVRAGRSVRRLWWLTPMMVVWVNMHGLFVLGLGLLWLAIGGAWLDRLLRRPSAAGALATRAAMLPALTATAACLVSPWPLEAFTHPLVLWQRVGGDVQYYTVGVSELAPTLLVSWPWPVHILLPAILAGATAMGMLLTGVLGVNQPLAPARRLASGHVLWLVVFTALGTTAIRNVAVAVLVIAPLAAMYLSTVLDAALAGRGKRLAGPLRWTAAALVAATALGAGLLYATGWTARWSGQSARAGFGVLEDHYPADVAARLSAIAAPGDVLLLNFGDAGSFLHFVNPPEDRTARRPAAPHKVFMDGRLELHSTEQFIRFNLIRSEIRASLDAARQVDRQIPMNVEYIVADYSSPAILRHLAQSGPYKLLFVGRNHVCFVRRSVPAAAALHLPDNLGDYDKPMPLDGSPMLAPEGTYRRSWWRANPPPTHWRLGAALYHLDQPLLSLRYLEAAQRLGIAPRRHREGMLAMAHELYFRRFGLRPETAPQLWPTMILPADVNASRALWLMSRPGVAEAEDPDGQVYDVQRVGLLWYAQLVDAADAAMEQHVSRLPVAQRLHLPAETANLRDDLERALAAKRRVAAALVLDGLSVARQAELLAGVGIGLPLEALDRLQAVENPDRENLLLRGDLHLRLGRVDHARRAYEASRTAAQSEAIFSPAALPTRLALCAWVQGDFQAALELLGRARQADGHDLACRYYHALLLEQIGRYIEAADALNTWMPAEGSRPHEEALQAAKTLAARLSERGQVTLVR